MDRQREIEGVRSVRARGFCLLSVGCSLLGGPVVSLIGQDEGVPETSTAGGMEARSSVDEFFVPQWGEDYQVRVSGGTPQARVMFSAYCEELRRDFRTMIFQVRPDRPQVKSPWLAPIRVDLWGEPEDVFTGDYVRSKPKIGPDGRFLIHVQVHLHDRFEEEAFRLAFIGALVTEQMLGAAVESPGMLEGKAISPPPWIVHGFDQLVLHRRGGSPSSFFEGFFQSGQMLEPSEIFEESAPEMLDPLSLEIFRASSAALVETLIDQEDGDISMRGLLSDLGVREGAELEALLRQHFPAFREMNEGIEKWWALQLATLGQQRGTEYLSREETERGLDEALTLRIEPSGPHDPAAATTKQNFFARILKKEEPAASIEAYAGPLEDYAEYLHRPDAKPGLVHVFAKLQQLKLVACPLYRPLVARYEVIVEKLARGQLKGIDEDIAEAKKLREGIGNTLSRAEDYLNHFEATRAPARSDAFKEYIEMRRELERKPPPPRNDGISRYMDALESEFR